MAGIFLALRRIDRVCETLSAIATLAIAGIVGVDVMLRYVFDSPLIWAYDLIGLYLMVLVFYAMLSATYAHHAHVSVDIAQHYIPPVPRRVCEIITCGLSCVMFAAVAYTAAARAAQSFSDGDVMSGAVAWPSWPPAAIAALGAGLLAVRLAVTCLAHLMSLGRHQVIPLPPLAGDEGSSAKGFVE